MIKYFCCDCQSIIDGNDDDEWTRHLGHLFKAMHLFVDAAHGGHGHHKPERLAMESKSLDGLVQYIKSGSCKNVVVLTGAGISVSAGIPDFRTPGIGLYDSVAHFNLPFKEAVFDIDYFKVHPEPFFSVCREMLKPGRYQPTNVHRLIKHLADMGVLLRNYTQNIDVLERAAGIPDHSLIEAHGSLARAHCMVCDHEYSAAQVSDMLIDWNDELRGPVPRCQQQSCKQGVIKPDVVFFGDSLPTIFSQRLVEDVVKCDLMIIIGTSLTVQPVATMVKIFRSKPRVLINLKHDQSHSDAGLACNNPQVDDIALEGDCQQIAQQLINALSI
ncbi:hypothetical protein SAMD00019534_044610, partial [Acytostelium subglobosum LB1]|uniref:hypothetical protein n=1 Tax=Acytostelium subglobosum LB1 TaxID=1410327 RepID=UPI000644EC1D